MDGLGGIELELTDGDQGDKEIGFEVVDNDGFFYDPRSYRSDFTDARYMGMGKWVDVAAAIEMFPDKKDELETWTNSGIELTSNSDRDIAGLRPGAGLGCCGASGSSTSGTGIGGCGTGAFSRAPAN